jgi:hypothetical protein
MSILTIGFTKESADVNALQKIVGKAMMRPRAAGAAVGGIVGATAGGAVDDSRGALLGAGVGATAGAMGGRRVANTILKSTKGGEAGKYISDAMRSQAKLTGQHSAYKPVAGTAANITNTAPAVNIAGEYYVKLAADKDTYPFSRAYETLQDVTSLGLHGAIYDTARQGRKNVGENVFKR